MKKKYIKQAIEIVLKAKKELGYKTFWNYLSEDSKTKFCKSELWHLQDWLEETYKLSIEVSLSVDSNDNPVYEIGVFTKESVIISIVEFKKYRYKSKYKALIVALDKTIDYLKTKEDGKQ